MSARRFAGSAFLFLATTLVIPLACSDDDPVGGCDPCPPLHYQDLSQKAHVLNNLELAYNQRQLSQYEKVLDAGFTMYFSTGDFNGGKTPELWGREDEIDATTHLFDPSYVDSDPSNGTQSPCTGIFMDVKWEDGLVWDEIEPLSDPGEKWYVATVSYNFQFDIEPDLHLINNPSSKAQFTVRNAGTVDAPHWQLVEVRDLDGEVVLRGSSRSTEQSTWGSVKASYHECTDECPLDLSEKELVLSNIELAYNQRRLADYDELLDADFTMFFAEGDVVNGATPDQWGRQPEVDATTHLFDPNYVDSDPSDGIQPRCTGISMDVKWEGGVQWQAIIPTSAPTETWYVTTVFYDFQFDIEPDLHLINGPGAKAVFTVRNAGSGAEPHWQLVEMRDLGSAVIVSRSSVATEQSTWGSVKALYL